MSASRIFTSSLPKKAFVLLILLVLISASSIWIYFLSTYKSIKILKTCYFLYVDAFSDLNYSIDKNLIQEKDQNNIIFFAMSKDVLNSSPDLPVAYFNGKGFMRRRGIVSANGSVHIGVKWEHRFMVWGLEIFRNELDAPAVRYEIISFPDLIQLIEKRGGSKEVLRAEL